MKKRANSSYRIIDERVDALISQDAGLAPYRESIKDRLLFIERMILKLSLGGQTLSDFASGHEYFGLHKRCNQWIFREWAPNATQIFLIGDFSNWRPDGRYALEKINNGAGIWEIRLPESAFNHNDLYRLRVYWGNGSGDRIPAYTRRVHQDPETLIFNAQVYCPESPYIWRHRTPPPPPFPLIYEAHIGMAQEKEGIGTYKEFTEFIIPRIVASGYNTLQLMALQEHPYYGSFGYHVSSLFAASSRFGALDDLKQLIDTAHGNGLRVLMDVVHSHAVSNEVEGLALFDGSAYQYFHEGPRGYHKAWDSRCYNYSKPEVLHFLLSNCRYWLDEFHIDGFRFDGITSMVYLHHGLNRTFTGYGDYFDEDVDSDALAYIVLANTVIHSVRPDATTIAEDVSGMPGLASPIENGGFGFDYRFAMGIPDYWIKLIKEYRDEDWDLGHLWFEMNNRRADEKTISYAESHDQALVGDQSLFFRLAGKHCYSHMQIHDNNLTIDRAIALHKMIRLITMATAGNGYLNFMGNEFGHPEWIDFPREGNNWSFSFARRQWSLVDDLQLKYCLLDKFDKDIVALAKEYLSFESRGAQLIYEHNHDKVIAFTKAGLLFFFNFNPTRSLFSYQVNVPTIGRYRIILNSDSRKYGGHGRISTDCNYQSLLDSTDNDPKISLRIYLPTRTAIVLAAD